MFRTPLTLFRTLAIAEVCSWTLLIAGIIARAVWGWDLAVTIGGAVHGFVFLSYGATALLVALNGRWRLGPTLLALASAVIPYATVPVERGLERRGLLAGQWRTEPDAAHPQRWFDPALRWFLRRPWMLVALILVAVVMVYTVLLLVGPPGGRA